MAAYKEQYYNLEEEEMQALIAKAKARAAGRPYPNLVDNVAAARAGHTKGKR